MNTQIKSLVKYLCEKTACGDRSSNTVLGNNVLANDGSIVASFESHAQAVRAITETNKAIATYLSGGVK